LNAEERGTADGESPRLSGEILDGSGDAVQCSVELSEKLSSCTDQSGLGLSKTLPDALGFGISVGASKFVPMAIAKRVADCLDLSNGSDMEVKDILRNGLQPVGVAEKIDRTVAGVPLSRFAAVTAVGRQDCDKLSSNGKEPYGLKIEIGSSPRQPKVVEVQKLSHRDTNILSSTLRHGFAGSAPGRFDSIVSEAASDPLFRMETFSSPEHSCMPRPPSARVSKKAMIATRAR
jgi:hypothetical protein